MPTISDLRAKISIDGAAQAKKDIADLKGKAGGGASGGGILGLAEGFKTGLGAVTGFITGFTGFKIAEDALGAVKDQLLDVLQAGMDQQKVQAQTAAVIKSTGGAAHVTAAQVGELADHLAQLTGISDDNIQSVTNLLLTFTDIKSNILPQTTALVLDMATAMHEDLNSAAIQVGKALQDPIQGATALRRVGVQLSQQQMDLVKHFVETGQKAKAQQIILGELTREMGGSAEAAGKTLPGQLARLNVSFDQAKEKIGLAVIPILQKLLDQYVMPLADWLGKHLPAAITVLTTFINTQLVPAITGFMQSPFVKTIEGWAQSIADKLDPQLGDSGLAGHTNTAKTAVKRMDDQMGTTTDKMAGRYATNVQKAIDKVDGLTTSLGGDVPTGPGLNPALKRVNANLDKMDAQLNANAKASQKAQQPTQFLGGIFDSLGQHIQGALSNIGNFGNEIQQRLGPAMPTIQRILGQIGDNFSLFGTGLHNVWDGIWGFIATPVKVAFHTVEGIVTTGLDLLGGHFDKAGKDIQRMNDNISKDIKDFGKSVWGLLSGIFETLIGIPVGLGKGLWNNAVKGLGQFKDNFSNWWTKTLLPAIQNAVSNFSHLIQNYINDHMPHFPGINIPGFGGNTPGRASGGPISGPFKGAEMGAELLVTPGLYYAPPGSYVYNAQQTKDILSGGGNGGGQRGNTYVTNVYPQQANIDTQELARIQRRRELLTGMH